MSVLDKARAMSGSQKNKIAIISAAVITSLIVCIWFLALRPHEEDSAVKENSTAESLKPLFMIFKGAKEDMKTIKSDAKTYKERSDEAKSITQ